MTPTEQLDTNYGATKKERDYVKETLDKKGVQELFNQETKDLSRKIVRNFHSDNYVAFEVRKTFQTEKNSMKNILKADTDMEKRYEVALAKNKTRSGFSEGILLVQAIAIKCVEKINEKESVESKLTNRNG